MIKASKTDRIIAFTDREITDFYAVKLAIEDDYIEIFDKCQLEGFTHTRVRLGGKPYETTFRK